MTFNIPAPRGGGSDSRSGGSDSRSSGSDMRAFVCYSRGGICYSRAFVCGSGSGFACSRGGVLLRLFRAKLLGFSMLV